MNSDSIYQLLNSCFPDEMKSREDYDAVNNIMYGIAESGGFELRNYCLYDEEKPIAYGSLFDMGNFENTHIAMLSGACTLAEYRKKGLYTTMLHLRLKHAMELGADIMIIQADKETSGPIVAKYGFSLIDVVTEYSPQDKI